MIDAPGPRGFALALGGGAALGWAHIGVLRVLERAGVPVAAAAGTSIGALAAVCLAADRLDALEAIARGATRTGMLRYLDPHLGRGAWLGGRRIARELTRQLGDRRLESLRLPVATVAADLDTGDEVRLTSGPAVAAVTASMALPGIFAPVEIGGRVLIDGGMVAAVPVAAARALAPASPVIAVDLMGDYAGHVRSVATHGPRRAVTTVRSAFLMMIRQQTRAMLALAAPEILITIPAGHRSTADFHRAAELIALGEAAAEAALPAISAMLPVQEAGTS